MALVHASSQSAMKESPNTLVTLEKLAADVDEDFQTRVSEYFKERDVDVNTLTLSLQSQGMTEEYISESDYDSGEDSIISDTEEPTLTEEETLEATRAFNEHVSASKATENRTYTKRAASIDKQRATSLPMRNIPAGDNEQIPVSRGPTHSTSVKSGSARRGPGLHGSASQVHSPVASGRPAYTGPTTPRPPPPTSRPESVVAKPKAPYFTGTSARKGSDVVAAGWQQLMQQGKDFLGHNEYDDVPRLHQVLARERPLDVPPPLRKDVTIIPKDIEKFHCPLFIAGLTKGLAGCGADQLPYDLALKNFYDEFPIQYEKESELKSKLKMARQGKGNLTASVGFWKSIEKMYTAAAHNSTTREGTRAATMVLVLAAARVVHFAGYLTMACMGSIYHVVLVCFMGGKFIFDKIRNLKYRKSQPGFFKELRLAFKDHDFERFGYIVGNFVNGIDPTPFNKFNGTIDMYNSLIDEHKITTTAGFFKTWLRACIVHYTESFIHFLPLVIKEKLLNILNSFVASRWAKKTQLPYPTDKDQRMFVLRAYAMGRSLEWVAENLTKQGSVPAITSVRKPPASNPQTQAKILTLGEYMRSQGSP